MSKIQRRDFLCMSAVGVAAGWIHPTGWPIVRDCQQAVTPSAFSIIPVVGDGKWVWTKPPNETGYLEDRQFQVSIAMQLTATGPTRDVMSTTVAPVEFPEQKVLKSEVQTQNCDARIQALDESAAQFQLYCERLQSGETASASAELRLKICKSYMNFQKDRFPTKQPKIKQAPKKYLNSSPGIKTTSSAVKQLAKSIVTDGAHPWDQAYQIYQWVWENIRGVPGKYTSVESAIKHRKGDCEERACTFIALCRVIGIPARQVWVPGHVWAEIALHDEDGVWHWIPVHTAAYSWFGWTGAHEVVLQKGDRIHVPSRNRRLRLIDDWFRVKGPRPQVKFTAHIKPLADQAGEEGPGERHKLNSGQWSLSQNSSNRGRMRDR